MERGGGKQDPLCLSPFTRVHRLFFSLSCNAAVIVRTKPFLSLALSLTPPPPLPPFSHPLSSVLPFPASYFLLIDRLGNSVPT